MNHYLPLACVLATMYGATLSAAPYKDGERAVIYGDSVTHHGYYVTPLQNFYYTRYPAANIHIWNCGVGGATSIEALTHFETDVVARKPTSAAILFGMNDVAVLGYQTNAPAWAISARVNAATNFACGMRDMKALFDKHLPQTKLTWCTLVPWDDELKFHTPRNPITGVTAGEKPLCAIVTQMHQQYGGGYVDYYTPMLAYNRKMHAQDPYTSLSPDTIHPREPGGLFMLSIFLKAQGVDGLVSDVTLNAAQGTCVEARNATAANIVRTPQGGLAFTLTEKSLPFPVEPAARAVANDIGFDAAFNREMMRIKDLGAGAWTLRIDGSNVVTATAQDWAQGINLATLPATPMLAQAWRVAQMNEQKRAIDREIRSMFVARMVAFRRLRWAYGKVLSQEEFASDRLPIAFIKGFMNAIRTAPHPDKSMYALFDQKWRNRSSMENAMEQIHRQICKINLPVAHRFELVPVKVNEK